MIESLFNGSLLLLALHLDPASAFPEPLSAEEEKKYLDKMMQGDEKAKSILVEKNLRLVAHVIKKYYSIEPDNEELISVGTVGLIKAINSFDPVKGVRLSTYAARCIDNEILMYFRNRRKKSLDISFDEPIETDSEGNPLTLMDIIAEEDKTFDEIWLKSNTQKLYIYIEEMKDEREKAIIIFRYGLNGEKPLTQNEIAKKFGISRSYVSRIETRGLKKLRKRFEKERSDFV